MKNIIIFLLFITVCCGCNHSTNPNAVVDKNKTEDTIVTPVSQILTHDSREKVITALYMMGCNDRLEMGLPDDYTENYYGFLNQIDSMMETPN